MRLDQRLALWLFVHVTLRGPLTRWAPRLLGYALGSRPRRVPDRPDRDGDA